MRIGKGIRIGVKEEGGEGVNGTYAPLYTGSTFHFFTTIYQGGGGEGGVLVATMVAHDELEARDLLLAEVPEAEILSINRADVESKGYVILRVPDKEYSG